MIKTKITMAIILISVVGMIVNSGSIILSNVQATSDEEDDTQSSNNNIQSSDNGSTQTSGDELPSSDVNNEVQTSDETGDVISTNQDLLPGLEQPNQQALRLEETPLQTSNTSTKDLQNPDIESDVNPKTTSSQNDLQSNYLAEMPFHPGVKDCYKSDGKMSFAGQWSCAEHSCTVAGYIACGPKVQETQKTTHDEYDQTKQIGNPFFGECKKDESGKCVFK